MPADVRLRALDIYNGDENLIPKTKACVYLGDTDPASEWTRLVYMRLFNWAGMNVLMAMRDLCERLILKGETQQVDRVLDAFARRWCECNPGHGFKTIGRSSLAVMYLFPLTLPRCHPYIVLLDSTPQHRSTRSQH